MAGLPRQGASGGQENHGRFDPHGTLPRQSAWVPLQQAWRLAGFRAGGWRVYRARGLG
ncbi:hypothetical protein ACL2XP_07600 [Sodalis sp. RH21]|uniref:hypothetical protein n=1 Tax=unclassified Sodalis (in: enterobacteria) TaxID=2636512 RepID=UPI0039B52547